jgi:hypothetical protein
VAGFLIFMLCSFSLLQQILRGLVIMPHSVGLEIPSLWLLRVSLMTVMISLTRYRDGCECFTLYFLSEFLLNVMFI